MPVLSFVLWEAWTVSASLWTVSASLWTELAGVSVYSRAMIFFAAPSTMLPLALSLLLGVSLERL